MFRHGNPPGTLGILCDPPHPALAQFPTEFHSNWQWFHLVTNSNPMILDVLPEDFRPIVQVIDNLERITRTRPLSMRQAEILAMCRKTAGMVE